MALVAKPINVLLQAPSRRRAKPEPSMSHPDGLGTAHPKDCRYRREAAPLDRFLRTYRRRTSQSNDEARELPPALRAAQEPRTASIQKTEALDGTRRSVEDGKIHVASSLSLGRVLGRCGCRFRRLARASSRVRGTGRSGRIVRQERKTSAAENPAGC